jgi:hypothetical protein
VDAPTRPTAEIARLGQEIYRRDIRDKVEAANRGRMVAIDVDAGDWAIDDGALAAADALRERRPAPDIWVVKVGHPTLRTFGGGSVRQAR